MQEDQSHDPQQMIALALSRYERLGAAIDGRIQMLAALDDGDTGDYGRVVQEFDKALHHVLDRHARLERTAEEYGHAGDGQTLDLDAARQEVECRLARLAAAGGADGVP